MSAAALLTRLQNAGASIRHDDGKLLVRAPTGRLTPDLVEELRHRKPLLLAILAGDHCRYCEDAIDWRRPHAVAFGTARARTLPATRRPRSRAYWRPVDGPSKAPTPWLIPPRPC